TVEMADKIAMSSALYEESQLRILAKNWLMIWSLSSCTQPILIEQLLVPMSDTE
ncbi:4293_t:CDS:2, partial [Dentiscutata erythropus]